MSIKNILIKFLGGYTIEELSSHVAKFSDAAIKAHQKS